MLFDVDGTLADTSYLHALAWARAFRELGVEVPTSVLHRLIGMGSDQLTERVLGERSSPAAAAHGRHFAPLRAEIRALPGAGDLVREVHHRGARTVLATSAKPEDIEALRAAIGADDAIDEVVLSSDVESSKPAPDIFAVALERAGVAAERAIAVGDTVWDIEAAGRCGVGCVAVVTGGVAACELEAAGAIGVYDDAGALLAELDRSPLARLLARPGEV